MVLVELSEPCIKRISRRFSRFFISRKVAESQRNLILRLCVTYTFSCRFSLIILKAVTEEYLIHTSQKNPFAFSGFRSYKRIFLFEKQNQTRVQIRLYFVLSV